MAARQRTLHGALAVWSTLAWGCISGSAGTPTGTYTITFTAQEGNITRSTRITLVVR